MEARVAYGSHVERPRLVVVKDAPATYSALPHAVLFSGLSDGAIRMYAVLQAHWWGESGECTASHATLAAEIGKKERTVRALLAELEDAEMIVARRAGRGQSKAYRAANLSGKNLPLGSGEDLPVDRPKRQKSASQAAENGQLKRQKSAAPIEEDSGKKTKEENKKRTDVRLPKAPSAQSRVIDLIEAGGVERPTFGGRDGKVLKDTGADPETVAAAYLAVWRGEWGDEWLRDNLSVHAVVDRLGGFQAWQSDQAPAAPHVNGTASKVTPATDDDRAIWSRALPDLRDSMNAANFETYVAPLEVAGRNEAGGLCLVVAPGTTDGVARMRNHIHRALMDAGDPAPLAVAFKARRSKEPSHAE